MKKFNIKFKQVIAGLCILLAGIFYTVSRGQSVSGPVFETVEVSASEVFGTQAVAGESAGEWSGEAVVEGNETNAQSMVPEETVLPREIFVHVCGEVKNPGVYSMEEGSRIYEALERAGGFTDRAATDFLNMAQMLEDGMKLIVPDEETAKGLESNGNQPNTGLLVGAGVVTSKDSAAASPQSDKVNINTAPKEQLMTLKGIGESRAEDIISYREQSGPFRTIEDIMKVSGIKEAAFQKIKENITV